MAASYYTLRVLLLIRGDIARVGSPIPFRTSERCSEYVKNIKSLCLDLRSHRAPCVRPQRLETSGL